MYGLLAARKVLHLLVITQRVSSEEFLVCQQRIDNLDAENVRKEFEVDAVLRAVFNGLNQSAHQFVLDWDHTHLRYPV